MVFLFLHVLSFFIICLVSDENLAMFESNLRAQGLNSWSVHQYRPAGHGFASIASDVYDELAATSSHFAMFEVNREREKRIF